MDVELLFAGGILGTFLAIQGARAFATRDERRRLASSRRSLEEARGAAAAEDPAFSDLEATAAELVRTVCDAFERRDVEALAELLTPGLHADVARRIAAQDRPGAGSPCAAPRGRPR